MYSFVNMYVYKCSISCVYFTFAWSHLFVVVIVIETGPSTYLSSSATSQGILPLMDVNPMVCT